MPTLTHAHQPDLRTPQQRVAPRSPRAPDPGRALRPYGSAPSGAPSAGRLPPPAIFTGCSATCEFTREKRGLSLQITDDVPQISACSVRPRSPDMAWSHSTSAAARFSSRAQTALGRSHLLNAFNTNSFRMVLLLASPSFTAPKPSHPIVKKWSLLGKNKSQKQSDWEPACSDSTAHSLQLDACHPESCTAGVCSLKYSVHKQAISIPLLLAPINSTCFYYNKSVTARQLS